MEKQRWRRPRVSFHLVLQWKWEYLVLMYYERPIGNEKLYRLLENAWERAARLRWLLSHQYVKKYITKMEKPHIYQENRKFLLERPE